MNKELNIHIIFANPFPIGYANANRIISLSKGLVSRNVSVLVHCIRPTEKKEKIVNQNVSGKYFGIKYNYKSGTVIWPKSKVLKLYFLLKGVKNSVIELFKCKRKDEIDVVIITITEFSLNFLYFLTCYFLRIKLVFMIDEYPIVVLEKEKYSRFYRYFYIHFFHKLFDAWIIMTKPLFEYYTKYARKKTKKIIIPMTVEPERFITEDRIFGLPENYMAYCGNPGCNNKDGVQILIQAFNIFIKKYPDTTLLIIGDTTAKQSNEFQALIRLTDQLGLNGKIIFTGRIHREEIPKYLNNAKALLLSRPNNIQAQGGFPTKLGEYLATGNPVVVTAVGEIPYYLKDGENAFVSEPDDPEKFANKMIEIFADYNKSKAIGLEGKKLAYSIFNCDYQANNLKNFLLDLIEK